MTRTAALAASALLTLAGCSAAPGTDSASEDVEANRESALFAAKSAVWSDTTIPVCWVNPSAEHEQAMAWTQDAVRGSWEAVSAVRFVGWGACQGSSGHGVRILIDEANPYSYLGTQGNGLGHTMLLNLTFDVWSADACKSNLEFCVRTIAVHEFGHALAFDHEQNRPDSPSWCQKDTAGGGDTVIGPWDLDSVMNYCNPEWSGNGTLSEIDIQGVQQIYGVAPADPGTGPEEEPKQPEAPCGGLTYEGTCQGDTVAWCENDAQQSIDCASIGRSCGWDKANGFYNCL